MNALHIAGLSLWLAFFQDPEADLRAHYEAAKRAQQAGDLNRAADEYRDVVRLAPQMAEAHVNLGLMYHALGRLDESIRELQTAERIKPGLVGVSLYLGIGYARLNQPRSALPWLAKAVQQEPGRKEVHTWLASALWDVGSREEAVSELEKTAGAFPADLDCLFLLGEGYRKAAGAILDRLTEEHPESALAHQIRAETYAAQGRWDRAARHYEHLCRMAPRDPGARLGLVASLIGQGKLDEARREARALPEHQREAGVQPGAFVAGLPAHSEAEPKAARALFDQHDYAGAVRLLRAAQGRSEAGTYLLARSYERLAVVTLERLVALDPESYRVHQLTAQLAEVREEYEKALAEYRTVETLRPTLSGIHYAIGNTLWRLGRAEEALPELLHELSANPNHVAANAEVGTIYVRQHEARKAVPFLELALRIEPGLTAARKDLGKAFYQLKRYQDAERELKLALPKDQDGSVHYVLGTVYRDRGETAQAAKVFSEARQLKAARLAAVSIGEKEPEEPEDVQQ
jgi:tetratricopeptide (TPR) repeat protein